MWKVFIYFLFASSVLFLGFIIIYNIYLDAAKNESNYDDIELSKFSGKKLGKKPEEVIAYLEPKPTRKNDARQEIVWTTEAPRSTGQNEM